MSKKMLVNATHHEENRVAIVEDGILTELDIEVAGHEPTKGNIYRAVVVRVEPGLQAAFVDYGAERLGFLQIDEINFKFVKPDYQTAPDGKRPRINDLLQRGQELLVQITKEERGTKGAALTTYLSLAGRYMVIMPGSQTRGVSRKAESDSQRKELKKAMSTLDMAENVGYIVRTAALNQTREELDRDYRYLIRLFENIKDLDRKVKAPALLYKESNLIIRSIRDYFTTEMDEVLIDDQEVFNEARDFFQMVMPDYARLVKLHQERRPIFSRYQIEEQIETLNRNKVTLPSGGSIVIDPTEALVAIDVNSGKMSSEQGVEATATKTNLEAAKEIGRQLRLRDLGGLVVVDFIDMRDRKHMREVENELKKSLVNDKARVSIGRISKFGLLEMSRQRLKATLAEGSFLPCAHCQGTGRLKSPETQAVSLLRKIHASAAKGLVSRIDAELPMDVAAYLLNYRREELVDMERDHKLQIHIHGNRDFMADQVEIELHKREKEKSAQPEYVAASLRPQPAEEPAPEQSSEPALQEDGDKEKEPAQKRRRRRRRKPAEATPAEATPAEATPAEATPAEESSIETVSAETAPAVVAPAPVDAPENDPELSRTDEPATGEAAAGSDADTEAPPTDAPVKKPQRRRRSQSKAKKPVAEQETAETETPQLSSEALQEEVKPKPRRGRRKKKPEEARPSLEGAVIMPTPLDSSVATDQSTGDQEQKVEIAKEVKTKPKRPRRNTKKAVSKSPQPEPIAAKETGSGPAEPTQVSSKQATQNSDSAAGPELTNPEVAHDKVSKPAEEPPAKAAAATEEKPKRRRSTRKAPTASKAADSAPVAEAKGTKEAANPTEEKPKPKRRASRAKSQDKKPLPATGVEPGDTDKPAKAETGNNAEGKEEKPKRRRAPRKKATPEPTEGA